MHEAVVADELPLVRAGMRAALTTLGVTVVADTHSGRDLTSLAASISPGLVIVGALADHHELDTVQRITAQQPAPLVVVLLTVARESALAGLLAAGADGIGRRSGTVDEIGDVVRRVLDGERVVAPSLTESLSGAFAEIDLDAVETNGDDSPLSARERELLVFLAQGRSNKEIADELSLSLATVKSHLVRMYAKLEVGTRADALAAAVSRGLLR
ncbi:MAG TPA: response regulator transcription factor [Acidimicrobiia bacterium]